MIPHRTDAVPALRRRAAAALAALVLAAVALAGCTTNPATGRSQLNVLSTEDEISLGEQAAPDFLRQGGGEIPDSVVRRYVSDLGAELAAVSENPELPWEFFTLDSQVINAFALPGGKVFISRGLMEQMDNEAQLVGVLGHEVGHVTARHANDRIARQYGLLLAAGAVGVAGEVADSDLLRLLGVGVAAGGPLVTLQYDRPQELEADRLGVRYMERLGYNPVGQVQVMEVLAAASGGGSGPEFLSTHPFPETRIEELNELIAERYPAARETGAYAFHHRRFEENVLARLADLPPATHGRAAGDAIVTPALAAEHGVLSCGHAACAHEVREARLAPTPGNADATVALADERHADER